MIEHLEQRLASLEGTVAQWREALGARSEYLDQIGEAQTSVEGRVTDLERKAIFAQRRRADQRTVVVLVPAGQVQTLLHTIVQATGGAFAVEVLE